MYDGNLSALNAYESRQAEQERNAPKCDICGEAIYEDFYEIEGDKLCQRCFDALASSWHRDIYDY